MSNDKSKRRTVVLDGSNIVSGGAGGQDVDGHRLVSAVDLYTKKGYDVIPVMKNGTYYWMKNNNITGFDAVRRLKNDGNLKMFGFDDDLYIIQMALDLNAWIVTQDTFEDKHDTKKERSQFPELPWEDIDDRTWGTGRRRGDRVRPNSDWSTSDSKFYHPRLPKCPSNGMVDSQAALREKIAEISSILDEVDQMAEKSPEFGEGIRHHVKYMLQRCGKMEAILPDPRLPDEEEIATILVPGLKDILRSLGLKVSGNRADLVTRIISYNPETSV